MTNRYLTDHARLLQAIHTLLELYKVPHFRIGQRGVMMPDGSWRVPGSDRGTPDIVAILATGQFWAIEAKTGKAGLSPNQAAARTRVEAAGGVWTTARSAVDDCEPIIKLALSLQRLNARPVARKSCPPEADSGPAVPDPAA